MTKLQGSEYELVAKHTIDKRSFVVSAASKAVWSTERVLEGNEIIEVVSELAGPSAVTIHQPVRGWYLLLKSRDAAFTAAQPHVNLVPSRTNPRTHFGFTVHSLTSAPVQDGSSGTVRPSHFTVHPQSHAKESARLSLRALKEVFASDRNSFSISLDADGTEREIAHYEDHPSLLHSDSKGTLSLDTAMMANLNIEKTFFVAVAIAYLGFMEDQAAYKAASE